jgi:heme exporter protein A
MMLRVTDMGVARGGVPVLDAVTLALGPGEALILRGPNGIGKTTLLRCIAGLQPALSGDIEAAPESLVYAGHADGIKSALTVTENLEFWARVFGTGDTSTAIETFCLGPLATRQAGALSAGQKRRLGLARLLVTGRPVWLLDEPTVSLDAEAVAMFAGAVRGHLAQGGAALIATHIDLRLTEAQVLDIGPFRAKPPDMDDFDGVFV